MGKPQRALFLSRTSALLAGIRQARDIGMCENTIARGVSAFPVYKRGEIKGWEAWYPTGNDRVRSPVMEET